MTRRTMPAACIEEIDAEVKLVHQLIRTTAKGIDSSVFGIPEFLRLEFCRVEQPKYVAGLLYALGYPTMVAHLEVLSEMNVCDRTDADVREPVARDLKVIGDVLCDQ